MKKSKKQITLAEYTAQTRIRLILWFILILLIVGLGLIWLFYGKNAAFLGLMCLLGAGIPIALIAFFLLGLEAIVKKSEKK